MFEELKKQSRKSVLGRICLGAIIIVVLLVISFTSIQKLIQGPKDLYSLSANELPDEYITGDINVIIDIFAEYYVENDDGTEDVTDSYYIIPVGEEEYIALEIKEENFEIANQIYNETYDYLMGYREDLSTYMTIEGSINEMSDEIYEYYEDWFYESGILDNPTPEEIDRFALPYVIQIDYVGGFESTTVYLMIAGMGLVLLYAIVITLKLLTGAYIAPIKKFIQRNQTELNEERLEVNYQNAVPVETLRIGQNLTFYFKGSKANVKKNEDLIWAYLEEVTHRVYGIKSGVSKSLVIYDKDKKKVTIPMKKKENVISALTAFAQVNPHMVIGFSEELKTCFKEDYETFKKIPYMNHEDETEYDDVTMNSTKNTNQNPNTWASEDLQETSDINTSNLSETNASFSNISSRDDYSDDSNKDNLNLDETEKDDEKDDEKEDNSTFYL
jgi:hypothetical protein